MAWNGPDYKVELKPGVTPYHARAYPIPKVHERTLKMECDRLCKVGVLREINDSEWAAPCFIIPKKTALYASLGVHRTQFQKYKIYY